MRTRIALLILLCAPSVNSSELDDFSYRFWQFNEAYVDFSTAFVGCPTTPGQEFTALETIPCDPAQARYDIRLYERMRKRAKQWLDLK